MSSVYYDYVIYRCDCITNKNYTAVNKNQAKTSTAFKYVDKGTQITHTATLGHVMQTVRRYR